MGVDIFVSTERTSAVARAGANKDMIVMGTTQGLTYASQLEQMEAYRPEKQFSDAVKALHVYGARVVQPDRLFGVVYAKA